MLDRLGDSTEIVEAARDHDSGGDSGARKSDRPGSGSGGGYRKPGIGQEITAFVLMIVGSVVLLLLRLVGIVLLWSPRRLTTVEKIVATLVVPDGPLSVGYLFG